MLDTHPTYVFQKGVKRFGLHSFLASNMTDNDYYPTMARLLFQTAVELHEALGAEFFMNHFGTSYMTGEVIYMYLAAAVVTAVLYFVPWINRKMFPATYPGKNKRKTA